MTLHSPSENFEIQYLMGVVKINIRCRKNYKQMFLLVSWVLYVSLVLALIVTIGYQMITGIFYEGKSNSLNFLAIPTGILLIVIILIFGAWGSATVYLFFWQVAGLEALEISHNVLKIRKTIFGIGTTKEYEQDKIKNIRIGEEIMLPLAFLKFKFAQFKVPITGSILVDAKDKKIEYLGLGLEPKQAEKIVVIIQQQLFPNHA